MLEIVNNIEEATAITHSGVFHADDVMAAAILLNIFQNIKLCRISNPTLLSKAPADAIVFDIGGGKFDHHQKGGNGARINGIPYSSCGLIWKEYGLKSLAMIEENSAKDIWNMVDIELMQGIDSLDNGHFKYDNITSFSSIISSFNPNWNSSLTSDYCFIKAVDYALIALNNIIDKSFAKVEANAIIEKAIDSSDGNILVLDKFAPWQHTLFTSLNKKAETIKFVVFPSARGGFNTQCVPETLGSFNQKKTVPSIWKGLRDSDFQKASGVKTATFCHNAGFICGAQTKDDAIALAKIALNS